MACNGAVAITPAKRPAGCSTSESACHASRTRITHTHAHAHARTQRLLLFIKRGPTKYLNFTIVPVKTAGPQTTSIVAAARDRTRTRLLILLATGTVANATRSFLFVVSSASSSSSLIQLIVSLIVFGNVVYTHGLGVDRVASLGIARFPNATQCHRACASACAFPTLPMDQRAVADNKQTHTHENAKQD